MSLVGWYRCDDNAASTAVVDSSGNGHGGVAARNTSLFPGVGKVGGALNFNGSTDVVTVADNADLAFGTGDFTVSVWVNSTSYSAVKAICGKALGSGTYAGWIIRWDSSSGFHFLPYYSGGNSVGDSLTSPATGTWYHLVAVRLAGQIYIYRDGVSRHAAVANTNNVTGNTSLIVGGPISGYSGAAWPGLIDDLRIDNTAWTAAQVAAVWNQTKGSYRYDPWRKNVGGMFGRIRRAV